MTERPTHRPGSPCLVLLASPDVEATAHFYGGLFGWSVPPGNGSYIALQLDGRDVAGMLPLPEEARATGATSRWLVYMAADDIGRRLERVRPAGGTILAPAFDVPGAGRMAMVADATGAEFGGVGGVGPPRRRGHGRARLTDLGRALHPLQGGRFQLLHRRP